jgi:hypothetical protein
MLDNKETVLRHIIANLCFSSKETSMENAIGLFNSNTMAQSFFADLFTLIFGYDSLEELDILNGVTNYPAIDLGDKKARIAFQITTRSDSSKIVTTIDKFVGHELYNDYDRLIYLVIGTKQKSYTTNFDTKSKFNFDPEQDIWDDETIAQELRKIKSIDKLNEIQSYLEQRLENFKYPARLTPNDIKRCIELLSSSLSSHIKQELNLEDSPIDIANRDHDSYITHKNSLNGVSYEFFKSKISGDLKNGIDITNFLSDPINQDILDDYNRLATAINEFCFSDGGETTSFEIRFAELFEKVPVKYNDDFDYLKLKILLHNMYFNCDIGVRPVHA